ncbi:MAG: sulfatase-like hydrolase/transferase [Planctomycetes bacterium]|nr:sulfatase-like hydrolase/transferase [Planctomycetota bacterium]
MKTGLLRLRLLALAIALASFLASAAAGQRPNIIFILSDDHRADVLGCAGHPVVKTPNIDKLAQAGVRYSNAFVTTSICAASRATLLTGLLERSHRYTFGKAPISKANVADSYPAQLKAAGYRTGFVGKFGVKVDGGKAAIESMFDSYVPVWRSISSENSSDGLPRHFTDVAGDKAIEFIASNPAGQPFCLSLSFNAAHAEDGDKKNHYPYPETEEGLYLDIKMPRPKLDAKEHFDAQPEFLRESMNRDRYFWRWDNEEKYDRNMRNYFRMLSGMDRNIGRVLAELESRELAENTVVIFMGDNGYYMGERGFAGKWSHYEESLRVPLVVYDPRDESKGGVISKDIALNLDIAPTILHYAELATPDGYQGRALQSFAGVLPRDGFFCEHRMENNRIPKWEGFRGRRYVYANYYEQESNAEFLHDLKKDPDQLLNLATDPTQEKLLDEMRLKTRELSNRYASEPLRRSAAKSKVLLLGDSISMGYHSTVVAELASDATVIRPRGNCAGTTNGIAKIDDWLKLDGGNFDLIHFNFGLHDLKAVTVAGGSKTTNHPSDPRQADLETYRRQLEEIVQKLKASGAKLIFATTTPYPDGVRPHRDPLDAGRYNAVALQIMAAHQIEVNDLYHFALPKLGEIQQPVNVHFTKEGSTVLGREVGSKIRQAIKTATLRSK